MVARVLFRHRLTHPDIFLRKGLVKSGAYWYILFVIFCSWMSRVAGNAVRGDSRRRDHRLLLVRRRQRGTSERKVRPSNDYITRHLSWTVTTPNSTILDINFWVTLLLWLVLSSKQWKLQQTTYLRQHLSFAVWTQRQKKISFKTGSVVCLLAFKRNKTSVRLFVISFRGYVGSKGNWCYNSW